MRIIEHYFNKTDAQSKIYLDLQPNLCIVYVTKDGLQLLDPPEKELTTEEAHSILKFIEEYLDTISEEEKTNQNESTDQSGVQSANQTTNPNGEVPQSPLEEDSKSNGQAEERREGEGLGSGLEQKG